MPCDRPGALSGLALARAYSRDVVEPLMRDHLPQVAYASARVGAGSEVLGLDDVMSQDHDWGLRLQLFVSEEDVPAAHQVLDRHLPDSFRGHPVRFTISGEVTARHRVDVMTPAQFAHRGLGFDPTSGATTAEWLSLTGQAVLEVLGGNVFTDQVGDLTRLRRALTWYPDDIWRYVVACDWQRLDQELPLMARAGDRGDDLGSRVIVARLVDVAVHLAFMLSRTWPPYSKWRGTVFQTLPIAQSLAPHLHAALSANRWQDRDVALREALERLAGLQLEVGLPACRPAVVPFWDRPYSHVEPSLVPALMRSVTDPGVRDLPLGIGGIDQRTDNVDVLVDHGRRRGHSPP